MIGKSDLWDAQWCSQRMMLTVVVSEPLGRVEAGKVSEREMGLSQGDSKKVANVRGYGDDGMAVMR